MQYLILYWLDPVLEEENAMKDIIGSNNKI